MNPFGSTTEKKDRAILAKTFTREQCLAAARMGGLCQTLILAIESRLRQLAGTIGRSERTLSTHPTATPSRASGKRRPQRQPGPVHARYEP